MLSSGLWGEFEDLNIRHLLSISSCLSTGGSMENMSSSPDHSG